MNIAALPYAKILVLVKTEFGSVAEHQAAPQPQAPTRATKA